MNSKKIYTTCLLAFSSIFILTACDNSNIKIQKAVPPMTQPIVQEMPALQSSTEQASSDIAHTDTPPTTPDIPQVNTLEDITTQYYQLVGEEEAIKADIELLEQNFRINQLSPESFYTQKIDLEQQENSLDHQIDLLEDLLPANIPPSDWIDTTNPNAMLQKKQELSISEQALKAELFQSRYNYISGAMTREDYIKKVIELEQKEDIIDDYEDFLEDFLELLGYDD